MMISAGYIKVDLGFVLWVAVQNESWQSWQPRQSWQPWQLNLDRISTIYVWPLSVALSIGLTPWLSGKLGMSVKGAKILTISASPCSEALWIGVHPLSFGVLGYLDNGANILTIPVYPFCAVEYFYLYFQNLDYLSKKPKWQFLCDHCAINWSFSAFIWRIRTVSQWG